MKSFDVKLDDPDAVIRGNVHRIARHIMLELALPNGKRTGIFNEMTCDEVKNAEVEGENGYVILVAEGKTFRTSGAAGVYCTKSEYKQLCQYISKIRPLLKPNTDQVFCRQSGERAEVSETGDFLQSAWSDFGAMISKDVGALTFSLLRKTLVSTSRKQGVSTEIKEQMAKHMDHSVQTADRYYDTSTGSKLTAQFRNTFNKFHDPVSSVSDECSDSSQDNVKFSTFEDLDKTSFISVPSCSDLPKSVPGFYSTSHCQKQTFGKTNVFSDEDKLALYRCCSSLIERHRADGKGATKSEILASVKAAGPNFTYLLKSYTVAQICNRVRCEVRKKK